MSCSPSQKILPLLKFFIFWYYAINFKDFFVCFIVMWPAVDYLLPWHPGLLGSLLACLEASMGMERFSNLQL